MTTIASRCARPITIETTSDTAADAVVLMPNLQSTITSAQLPTTHLPSHQVNHEYVFRHETCVDLPGLRPDWRISHVHAVLPTRRWVVEPGGHLRVVDGR